MTKKTTMDESLEEADQHDADTLCNGICSGERRTAGICRRHCNGPEPPFLAFTRHESFSMSLKPAAAAEVEGGQKASTLSASKSLTCKHLTGLPTHQLPV